MTAAASRFSVVDNTPRFRVGGEDRPSLSVRVQRLEVCHDEEGLRWMEGYFIHSGPRQQQEPGFLFEGSEAVALGASIEVAVGDDDNRTIIFAGRVSAIGAHFPTAEPALLKVCAEDGLMELRMQRHARAWEVEDDGVIIDEATRPSGLRVAAPAGDDRANYAALNRAPLSTLRERARELDKRIEWVDGEVTFVDRRAPSEPIVLRWFDELLSFEARADLAHQRTQVRVHGYSRAQKGGVTGVGDASSVQPESRGGTSGPDALSQLGIDAVENTHIELPGSSREADETARVAALQRARRFVTGEGVTRGTPDLAVGALVDLRGLDQAFGGEYDVVKVRHVFDRQQGLRTHFDVSRVDFAGEVAR